MHILTEDTDRVFITTTLFWSVENFEWTVIKVKGSNIDYIKSGIFSIERSEVSSFDYVTHSYGRYLGFTKINFNDLVDSGVILVLSKDSNRLLKILGI